MVATVARPQLTPVKRVASSFKQLCRMSVNKKRTITISHPVLISQGSTEVAVKIQQLDSLIADVTRLIELPRAHRKPLTPVAQSSVVAEQIVPVILVPAASPSTHKPRKHLSKNIDSIAPIAAFLTSHPSTFNPSCERSTPSAAQLGSRGTPDYLAKGLSLMERLREQRNSKLQKTEEEAKATKETIAEHVEVEVVEVAEEQREAAAKKAEEEEGGVTDDEDALISDDDSDSSASSSEPGSPPPSPLFDSSRKLFGDCLPPAPPRKAFSYERRTRTNTRAALNSTILTLRAEFPRRRFQPTTIAEDEDEEEESEQHIKDDSRFVKLSPYCRPRPVFRRAPPSLEKEESRGMQLMVEVRARLVEQQREQDERSERRAKRWRGRRRAWGSTRTTSEL